MSLAYPLVLMTRWAENLAENLWMEHCLRTVENLAGSLWMVEVIQMEHLIRLAV